MPELISCTTPFRYTSPSRFMGLPLYEIAHGPDVRRGLPYSETRAILAIGDSAVGGAAVGLKAFGGAAHSLNHS